MSCNEKPQRAQMYHVILYWCNFIAPSPICHLKQRSQCGDDAHSIERLLPVSVHYSETSVTSFPSSKAPHCAFSYLF